MLAPRAASAFVCLRCEVQRARRPLPSFARPSAPPSLSTSARARNDGDVRDALSQLDPPALKIIKERPLGDRFWRCKGTTMRETSARLGGIKTLGDDTDILVLREVADLAESAIERAAATPVKMPPREIPDIAASLHEERRRLSPRDVHQRIENLRPRVHGNANDVQYVSQMTFVKLMKLLTTGFTLRQLSAFYSVTKKVNRSKVTEEVIAALKGDKGTLKRPVERSEWQPGTTMIRNRLPGLDVAFQPKKRPVSKKLMIDRILRDCWKMVLLEEMEAPGEIELWLQPWQMELLNVGESDTVLEKIGQTRRAKFDFHREHQILRITADKTTAEYTANDIEKALQNAETKRLNLLPWFPLPPEAKARKPPKLNNVFTQSRLDAVSSLTHTIIGHTSAARLTIQGLDANAVAEAERLLIRLLPLKDPTTHSIDSRSVEAAKESNYLIPVFLAENTLDLKNRKVDLGRNSMPITRSAVPEAAEGSEQSQDVVDTPANTLETYTAHMDLAVAAMHRSAEDTPSPAQSIRSWPSSPEYLLSAELGQALFPLNNTSPTPKSSTTTTTSPLIFNPSTPGLTSLLTSPHFTATTRMQTPSLIYDFIPSPTQAYFKPGQLFPELRIQMRTARSGSRPHLHSLTLGFDKRIHNVLLPSLPADLRFRSSARLSLKRLPSVAVVQDWVEKVVQNIESGGRLSAPDLSLEIPTWTIPGANKDAPEMSVVTYLFSGVQFRQSVSGVVGETMVAYRTTQAGQLGAKSGVLSAHYSGDGDVLLRDEGRIRAFVQAAFGLVHTVAEGVGQTVPVSKRLNPRDVVSARKIRRAQEQALRRAREAAGEAAEGAEDDADEDADEVGLDEPWAPLQEGKKAPDQEPDQYNHNHNQGQDLVDEAKSQPA